jgi:glycosyltransferase involved in cell wall biosynthesis
VPSIPHERDTNRRTEKYALPPVSIIMAVYNGERYIAQAIESVLHQTHQDFEFVIVDDGSTDRTPRILAHYATRDKRVGIISQENMDQPRSLNRALAAASSE